jgi:heme exporter protein B
MIRNLSSTINPLLFFVIAISLFPLAISPEPTILKQIAPGIIWVVTMLSVLLSLSTIFNQDYDSGVLEQIVLSPKPLATVIFAKTFAHWLTSGLPIIILAPLITTLLYLENLQTLLLILLLTTPTLSLIGIVGATLTVSLKRSSILMTLIILPLYIPLLIFASSAFSQAQIGLDISGHIYLLSSLLLFSIVIVPFLSAFILKTALED